jgi:hypothetical protein
MMSNNQSETQTDQERVQRYQAISRDYEALDKAIDTLIMKYDGASKNMPDDVLDQYREMARRRRDLHNEMLILEQVLFDDEG